MAERLQSPKRATEVRDLTLEDLKHVTGGGVSQSAGDIVVAVANTGSSVDRRDFHDLLGETGCGEMRLIYRLAYAFRRCTGRQPSEREAAVLLGFLGKQMEKFSAANAKPWDLAANDPANPPKLANGVTPAQAAAWTAVARMLLNLDETITKE